MRTTSYCPEISPPPVDPRGGGHGGVRSPGQRQQTLVALRTGIGGGDAPRLVAHMWPIHLTGGSCNP